MFAHCGLDRPQDIGLCDLTCVYVHCNHCAVNLYKNATDTAFLYASACEWSLPSCRYFQRLWGISPVQNRAYCDTMSSRRNHHQYRSNHPRWRSHYFFLSVIHICGYRPSRPSPMYDAWPLFTKGSRLLPFLTRAEHFRCVSTCDAHVVSSPIHDNSIGIFAVQSLNAFSCFNAATNRTSLCFQMWWELREPGRVLG